ncbi:MAG: OmpA family protein [Alphaproteobacteria bacterium]|nr:OmpA family protein [Alphaproteobacteria bacterium]
MTIFSAKTAALATILVLGSLVSTSAHAAILRSSDGVPVLTRDGNCVITNWEGSDECAAAKAAAGLGDALPTAVAPVVEHESSVYFAFGKTTLSKRAMHDLDRLAAHLRPHCDKMAKHDGHHRHHHHRYHHRFRHVYNMPNLIIAGYADRIGNADYNQKLALRRAEAVRDYLMKKGVKARSVELRSLGKTEPRADCSADLPRAKLINCLREDRRVDIEVLRP